MWSIDLQFNNNNDNDDDDGTRKKNIYKEEKKQKMGIRDGPAAKDTISHVMVHLEQTQ